MNNVTPQTLIADVILKNKKVIDIFNKHDMRCYSCPYRWEETIKDGAGCHNVDLEELLNEINSLD